MIKINHNIIRAMQLLCCTLLILNCSAFAQNTSGGIYSSGLGEFTIGIDNKDITGNYLFLDNWDSELKVHMRQNYFSFSGHIRTGKFKGSNFYNITITTDIDTAKTPGFIEISADGKKLTIVVQSMDALDAAFDMSQYTDKNIFTLKIPLAIKKIGVVKAKQARLFNYEGGKFVARKSYLVAGDDIGLINTIGSFSKVFYKNPITAKSGEYYVQTSDLSLIAVNTNEKSYINNMIRLSNY